MEKNKNCIFVLALAAMVFNCQAMNGCERIDFIQNMRENGKEFEELNERYAITNDGTFYYFKDERIDQNKILEERSNVRFRNGGFIIQYQVYSQTAKIPECVNALADRCFANCGGLMRVKFSRRVRLGQDCFKGSRVAAEIPLGHNAENLIFISEVLSQIEEGSVFVMLGVPYIDENVSKIDYKKVEIKSLEKIEGHFVATLVYDKEHLKHIQQLNFLLGENSNVKLVDKNGTVVDWNGKVIKNIQTRSL